MSAVRKKSEQSPMDWMPERRHAERHSVHREGWLRSRDGTIIPIAILDVSAGGAGVAMIAPRAIDLGDQVELSIDMPSAHLEAWLPCTVTWRVRDRLGLAFRTPLAAAAALGAPHRRSDC